jgi:hypothetical protein
MKPLLINFNSGAECMPDRDSSHDSGGGPASAVTPSAPSDGVAEKTVGDILSGKVAPDSDVPAEQRAPLKERLRDSDKPIIACGTPAHGPG